METTCECWHAPGCTLHTLEQKRAHVASPDMKFDEQRNGNFNGCAGLAGSGVFVLIFFLCFRFHCTSRSGGGNVWEA